MKVIAAGAVLILLYILGWISLFIFWGFFLDLVYPARKPAPEPIVCVIFEDIERVDYVSPYENKCTTETLYLPNQVAECDLSFYSERLKREHKKTTSGSVLMNAIVAGDTRSEHLSAIRCDGHGSSFTLTRIEGWKLPAVGIAKIERVSRG